MVDPWRHVSTGKRDGTFYEAIWRDSRGDLNRCYLRWSDGNDTWMTEHGALVWKPLYIRDLVPMPDGGDGLSHLERRRMPKGAPVAVAPAPRGEFERTVRQCASVATGVYVGEGAKQQRLRDEIATAILELLPEI